MMKKLEVKDCPLCGEVIWKRKMLPLIQHKKWTLIFNFFKIVSTEMNNRGTHFWLLLSDSSRMRVAVCKRCCEIMDDKKAKEIFSYITYTKLKLAENGKWESYDYLRTLEVFRWFKTEKEVIEYLKEYNKNASKHNS